jgi:predicted HicB family RNase H-like nuclease
MAKPEEYGISVRLVREGEAEMYEARVVELPDVRTYGDTWTDAYTAAVEVVRTTQEIFAEKGRPFPEVQVPEEEFSGRVTLRMSKSLHRDVHERAERDGVSLNQWIVEAVSIRVNSPTMTVDSYLAFPTKPQEPQTFIVGNSLKGNVCTNWGHSSKTLLVLGSQGVTGITGWPSGPAPQQVVPSSEEWRIT